MNWINLRSVSRCSWCHDVTAGHFCSNAEFLIKLKFSVGVWWADIKVRVDHLKQNDCVLIRASFVKVVEGHHWDPVNVRTSLTCLRCSGCVFGFQGFLQQLRQIAGRMSSGPRGAGTGLKLLLGAGALAYGVKEATYTGNLLGFHGSRMNSSDWPHPSF